MCSSSAVGFLNVPRYPDWPGLDRFAGPAFHTARWEHDHDLTDKVVAVVGTGSSATQVVPAIQPIVKQLYVFQREPGWIMPKGERDLTDEERAGFAKPWSRRRERWRLRILLERSLWRGRLYRPGTKTNEARRQFCLSYIERQFADRPDLREAVTPTYPYPGKRPIFASGFYRTLKKQNVELVPRAVRSMTRTGIVDANGIERAIDVVVLATGFQRSRLSEPTSGSSVATDGHCGSSGRASRRAYLGITVPGFPNFFMCYGPGTNGGEIVTMLESQADYAVRAIRRMIRKRRIRGGGEAELRGPLVSVAPVEDEGHLLDHHQHLLQVAHRQDRDAMAVRKHALPRPHPDPGADVGDRSPPRVTARRRARRRRAVTARRVGRPDHG